MASTATDDRVLGGDAATTVPPSSSSSSAADGAVMRAMATVFLDNGVEAEGLSTLRNLALTAIAFGLDQDEVAGTPLATVCAEVTEEPAVAAALEVAAARRDGADATVDSTSIVTLMDEAVFPRHQQETLARLRKAARDENDALVARVAQEKEAADEELLRKSVRLGGFAAQSREQRLTRLSSKRQSMRKARPPQASQSPGAKNATNAASTSDLTPRRSAVNFDVAGEKTDGSGSAGLGRSSSMSGTLRPVPSGSQLSRLTSKRSQSSLRELAKAVIAKQLPSYASTTCVHCRVPSDAPKVTEVRSIVLPADPASTAPGEHPDPDAEDGGVGDKSFRTFYKEATDPSNNPAATGIKWDPEAHHSGRPDVQYPLALGLTEDDQVEHRLWLTLAGMRWPEHDPHSGQPLSKEDRAEMLATHFQSRVGVPPWAEFFFRRKREEIETMRRQTAYQQAASKRLADLQSKSAATKLEIAALEKALSVRDPVEHAAQVQVALAALQRDLNQMETTHSSQTTELDALNKYAARYAERITMEVEEIRRCLRLLQGLRDIAREDQSRVPPEVMETKNVAELILPVLERIPTLAMTQTHDDEDDDGGDIESDPLGHQCPDCLLLKSSSPFCTVSGRRHQKSMPIDARPMSQNEQDLKALEASREAGDKTGSDSMSEDGDSSDNLSSIADSVSSATSVSDTTSGADSDGASVGTRRRRQQRRQRRTRYEKWLMRRAGVANQAASGQHSSPDDATDAAAAAAADSKRKKRKKRGGTSGSKPVNPSSKSFGTVAVAALKQVQSRYREAKGARGKKGAGKADAEPVQVSSHEQMMKDLAIAVRRAFPNDHIPGLPPPGSEPPPPPPPQHHASRRASQQPHHHRGRKASHSQSHPMRGSSSANPTPSGSRAGTPRSGGNRSRSVSPGAGDGEDPSLRFHAEAYVPPQGEEAAVQHCRDFMQAVSQRNVGQMRQIANLGMDEAGADPQHATKRQLHDIEGQFSEWYSLMMLRTTSSKVSRMGKQLKSDITSTTVAQTEAVLRSLRKELRNLSYSFDKRPKGRHGGATLDDAAFKALVQRIGDQERRSLHLRTRMKYAVSERHILENKYTALRGAASGNPAPTTHGHGGIGGDASSSRPGTVNTATPGFSPGATMDHSGLNATPFQ